MKTLKSVLAVILAASTLAFSASAFAAVKPGASCKKLGITSTSGKIKYTCIISGKKLIWNKGSKVVLPVSKTSSPVTVDPTPTASPSPTPIATPTQKPEPFQPTSIDDLIAHPDSMSYWAWKKSATKIAQATDPGPTIVLHVGPNTTLTTSKTSEAIIATSRLYSGFSAPTKVHVIYYSYQDISWGQNEFAKLALRPDGQEAARQCQTPQTCWGASAEIDLKGNGILLMSTGMLDSNHTSGTVEAHEYAHTLQGTQFVGTQKEFNSYCCTKTYMPWWMIEGGAEFAQAAAIYSDSYESYLFERDTNTNEFISNRAGLFTLDWIKSYLDISTTSMWSDPKNSWRMYDVGSLVHEALVAIKGPDISMKLNKDVANGMSWPQAFEANMGISWTEGLPKLATAIKGQLKK